MFQGNVPRKETETAEKIIKDVKEFSGKLKHLVIVSNNVFEDGIVYDHTTMAYNRALSSIHCEIAKTADLVVEVVVGIPIVRKGNLEEIDEDGKNNI